jgi:hypothetical protein
MHMARFQVILTTVTLAALGTALPAFASPCSDGIAALSGRVTTEARESIAASTGSKAIAARREGEGETGTAPVADRREASPAQSAQAGEGGDRAQQAQVALDEARTADAKGDAAGCEAALARARQQLDRAP